MRSAQFHNFTDKPFTCSWNSKPYSFKPGEKKFFPQRLAAHFAKHLANRVLLEKGDEVSTSPKKPEEVPHFMAEFNKAYQVQAGDEDDDLGVQIELMNQPSSEITLKPSTSTGLGELKTKVDVDDEDDYSAPVVA